MLIADISRFENCKYTHQYEEFIDLLNEFSLTQLVTKTTRFEKILDFFLIDNPTLVKSVDIKPDISDHDAVLSEVYIKPQVSKQKPRLMFMYKKTDWEGLESHMHLFQKSFLASHEGKSINLLWYSGKNSRELYILKLSSMSHNIQLVQSRHCHGWPKELNAYPKKNSFMINTRD